MSGRNSVVECQLPKLDVAGSSPVARSIMSPKFQKRSELKLDGRIIPVINVVGGFLQQYFSLLCLL